MHDNESHAGYTGKTLMLVLGLLLLLTAVTVTVARIRLGAFTIPVMLGIASLKSSLVLIYFMHIRRAGKAVTVTFIITIVTVAILISFIFWDISYR
jgi:cytochrome c oxidase subunit IV